MKLKLELEEGRVTLVCRCAIDKAIVKQTKIKQVSPKVIDEFEKYLCILDNKLTEAHQLFIGLITEPEGFVRVRYKDFGITFLMTHKSGVWVLYDVHRQYGDDMQVGAKSVTLYLDKNQIAKEAEKKLGKMIYFG